MIYLSLFVVSDNIKTIISLDPAITLNLQYILQNHFLVASRVDSLSFLPLMLILSSDFILSSVVYSIHG